MYPLGELGLDSTAEEDTYLAALSDSHRMRVTVDVLDRNEKHIVSIEPVVLDGQVNVDFTTDVTRSLSMNLLDPDHKLLFDTDNPADGALFADRFISVKRGIYLTAHEKWIDTPVFTGPVTGFERNGAEVTVEGQGKESLLLDPALAWRVKTYRKGTRITDAIKDILEGEGEKRLVVPSLSKRLANPLSVARTTQAWRTVRSLAKSVNRQIFYDGAGRARLRVYPSRSLFTFVEGAGGHLLTKPKVTYDMAAVRNIVQVTGVPPKGSKRVPHGVSAAAKTHPLSPWSLARNGKPRYLVHLSEASHARTDAACKEIATRVLRDKLREGVNIEFESFPIPFLEEDDMVSIKTEEYSLDFKLRQFSIPLTSGANMSVGTLKRVKVRKWR